MEIKYYTSQIAFHNQIEEFFNTDTEETKITVLDRTEAFYGAEGTCNKKWCEEHNIPYSHGKTLGNTGCIVSVKGNIVVDVKRFNNGGKCLSDTFSEVLCEYLKGKGLDSVRLDNNDVLVDDYKVASGADAILPNGFAYMGYQISINQDIEAIRNICMKSMIKVPKGLGEYGITTEEMLEFCKNYWNKN